MNVHVVSRAVAVAALVLVAAVSACGARDEEAAMPSSASASPGPSSPEPSSPGPSSPAASQPPPDTSTGRPLSPIPPPTLKPPTVGPSKPTDLIPGDILVGRVTKGGSGPCYGLVTDDNRKYALYNDTGLSLDEGTYIRATVGPLALKISCGEGTNLTLLSFKRL